MDSRSGVAEAACRCAGTSSTIVATCALLAEERWGAYDRETRKWSKDAGVEYPLGETP